MRSRGLGPIIRSIPISLPPAPPPSLKRTPSGGRGTSLSLRLRFRHPPQLQITPTSRKFNQPEFPTTISHEGPTSTLPIHPTPTSNPHAAHPAHLPPIHLPPGTPIASSASLFPLCTLFGHRAPISMNRIEDGRWSRNHPKTNA